VFTLLRLFSCQIWLYFEWNSAKTDRFLLEAIYIADDYCMVLKSMTVERLTYTPFKSR
jgi:hypothetical protein